LKEQLQKKNLTFFAVTGEVLGLGKENSTLSPNVIPSTSLLSTAAPLGM
jgi:hypothetical protein